MDIVTYALCKKMAGGNKGEKGDKGDKGDRGEQGLPGQNGQDGVTPNLQIGDVITLESGQQATITRRGDDENPIFDFAIPKGENGEDGIFVGRIEDAPSHAQIVVNDDASPYDLFYEGANVDYMGNVHTSLKEKADADIEYLLRKFATQHYEGTNIVVTDTYAKRVKSATFKGQTKYRDKITGEIVDSFQEGRNLELVSVKSPSLTTINSDEVKITADNVEFGKYVNYYQKEIVTTSQPLGVFKAYGIANNSYVYSGIKACTNMATGTEGGRQTWMIDYSFSKTSGFTNANKEDTTISVTNRNGYIYITVDIENLDKIRFKNINAPDEIKSHTLTTPSDLTLRGIGNVQDTLNLITGEYIKRIETRPYQQGDESNADVLTDKVNTVYKLAQPITTKIDLNNQKVYSYDGTTCYTTSSLDGYPAPILSIDVPINVTTIIANHQEKLKQQEQKLQEQEEIQNLLIDSQLAWFEDNISTLELTDEDTPSHIQKLYEVAYQRGIRIRKEE